MTVYYSVETILLAEAVQGHAPSKNLMLQTVAAGAVAINAAAGYASL